ncbi:hypothetical protein [Bradyrhizobium sp. UFLA05-112]
MAEASACCVNLRSSRRRFRRTPMNAFFIRHPLSTLQTLQIHDLGFAKLHLFSAIRGFWLCRYCEQQTELQGSLNKVIGYRAMQAALEPAAGPERADTLRRGRLPRISQPLWHPVRRQRPEPDGQGSFVAANRRARCAVVMATSDKVQFHEPVRVGELVELTA